MGQSRSWREEQELIITNNGSTSKMLFALIVTTCLWLYAFSTIWFFISPWLTWHIDSLSLIKLSFKVSDGEIQSFLMVIGSYFLAVFLLMLVWRYIFVFHHKVRSKSVSSHASNYFHDDEMNSQYYLEREQYLSPEQIKDLQEQQIIKW